MLNNQVLIYWVMTIAVIFIFPVVACCGSPEATTTEKGPSATSMANPAAVKCINDGFVLKPIQKNGVPSHHICENPENGKKCEVWKYFRGECNLK